MYSLQQPIRCSSQNARLSPQSLPPGQTERPPRASAETFGWGVVWAAQWGLTCERRFLGDVGGSKLVILPFHVVTYQVVMANHGKPWQNQIVGNPFFLRMEGFMIKFTTPISAMFCQCFPRCCSPSQQRVNPFRHSKLGSYSSRSPLYP